METLVKRDMIYRGKPLTVHVDTVRLPNGAETRREVVEHPGAAVIVPIDVAGNVLLVRQFRYAIGAESLELPAGTREKGESPEETASRELEEETGYSARQWDLLTSFFSSPGILTEEMFVYLARDLAEGSGRPEEDEEIKLVKLTLAEALELVGRGEIRDAKTIIGLLLAEKKLSRMTPP